MSEKEKKTTIKCEKCGREIDSIITNCFIYDGTDIKERINIEVYPENAVIFDTDANWCGYELSEEEQIERIECPYCHMFPFKNKEIQIHEIVRVVCFKEIENE